MASFNLAHPVCWLWVAALFIFSDLFLSVCSQQFNELRSKTLHVQTFYDSLAAFPPLR